MPVKRRILAAAASMMLAAPVAAFATSPTPTLATTVTSAAQGRPQQGVTSSEIVFAQSAPLTGALAQLGKRMNAGANAYFSKINATGGVNGRRISLIVADDAHDPIETRKNTEKFSRGGAFALFGYVGTSTILTAKPVFDAAGIPMIAPMSGAPSLRRPVDRLVFNVRASYADEIEQQIQEIAASGALRIAIVHQNDQLGQAGATAARDAMRRRGLIPVVAVGVERKPSDIARAVSQIAGSRPSAVIMIAPEVAAPIISGLRAQGTNPLFYHISFTDAMSLLSTLGHQGPGVLVTQVVPFPWAPSIPVVKDYQDAMLREGDGAFDFASLEGYIAARVAAEGLRRAGPNLTRQSFVAALESMENVDLGGFLVNFGSRSHAGSTLVETTMIGNNGAYIQ